jgi:hypothetical protein
MKIDARLAVGNVAAVAVVLLLAGCGGGDSFGRDDAGSPPATAPGAARPSVSLSAAPASIASGASTMLTWASTNATSCVASGGWSGNKMTSGSETFNAVTQTTTFTLSCSGPAGMDADTVQVNVTGTGQAPALAFSASPSDVSVNGSAMLSWSSVDATSCAASGAWSGAKSTSGSELVGPLSTSASFTLTCSGAVAPAAQQSAIVTVSGSSTSGGVSGSVDSSLIDSKGGNQVYLFNGMVTPRDTQGSSGDAAFKLPVSQDANACTFGYSLPSLAMGTYTLAFTSQGQLDRPLQPDAIAFTGTMTVVVGNQPVRRNFRPANLLQVGPGRQFRTIAAAAAAANAGTVIEVDAGVYPDDIVVWRDDGVVVRGVGGGRPSVQGLQTIAFVPSDDRRNGKGIWVVAADRMRIENFEISGASVRDGNGAAIRNEGRDLTICNSFMHDNENGFLGAAFGTLTIEYSIFAFNGVGEGQTHNVYIDEGSAVGDRLIFRHNYSHHARVGHNLKTRARENFVLYNRIMDEADGTASYAIDFSDGGLAYVIGNLLQQGRATENPAIVAFNLENIDRARPQELYFINNTLVNDLGSGAFLDVDRDTTRTFRSVNNLFIGGGTLYRGKQPTVTTSLVSPASALLNALNFDYRLTANASAINAGTNPGSLPGVSLIPDFQYVHPARRESRSAGAAVDVGAYEAAQ